MFWDPPAYRADSHGHFDGWNVFSQLPAQYKNQYIYHEKSYKHTNLPETYLPVGMFRNELSFATDPWGLLHKIVRFETYLLVGTFCENRYVSLPAKRTNLPKTYLLVGTFRNELFYVTGPCTAARCARSDKSGERWESWDWRLINPEGAQTFWAQSSARNNGGRRLGACITVALRATEMRAMCSFPFPRFSTQRANEQMAI